jgi:putative acetyltransferase
LKAVNIVMSVKAHVRLARPEDHACLIDLWERAVRRTHTFLAERDIVDLRPAVAAELASEAIDWWVLECEEGPPIGFLGFAGRAIEGLFVDPDHHRRGAGRRLVAHAQSLTTSPLFVEVNEENWGAMRFYAALGFVAVRRSSTDGAGRPFPIVVMRRGAPAEHTR